MVFMLGESARLLDRCGLGSIFGHGITCWLSFLLVLVLASRFLLSVFIRYNFRLAVQVCS